MFENKKNEDAANQYKLLEELELNQPAHVSKSKSSEERELKVTVYTDPGNIRDRAEGSRRIGRTTKLGHGTVTATFTAPPHVGDVYLLTFERSEFERSPGYVQCRRVRLLTEDTFEAVLHYLAPVES